MGLKVTFTNSLSKQNYNKKEIKLPQNCEIRNYEESYQSSDSDSRRIVTNNKNAQIFQGNKNVRTADFRDISYNTICTLASVDQNANNLTFEDLQTALSNNTIKNNLKNKGITVQAYDNFEKTGQCKVIYSDKEGNKHFLNIDMTTENEEKLKKKALETAKEINNSNKYNKKYKISVTEQNGKLFYKIEIKKDVMAYKIKNNLKIKKGSILEYNRSTLDKCETKISFWDDSPKNYDDKILTAGKTIYVPVEDTSVKTGFLGLLKFYIDRQLH